MGTKRKLKTRQNKTASKQDELTKDYLNDLPDEILLEIIKYLKLDNSNELANKTTKKHENLITLTSGKRTTLWTYQHKPQSPILTSFQSFSIVNHRLYSICRPLLWKAINFPTLMPIPMSYWNDELLPKHGPHVQSITIRLTEQWFEIPPKPISIKHSSGKGNLNHYSLRERKIKFIEQDKDFWDVPIINSDNLAVSAYLLPHDLDHVDFKRQKSHGLSPQNVIKVISQCSQLSTLRIRSPDAGFASPDPIEMWILRNNLTSLLSDLKQLRHLQISGPWLSSILAGCIIEPIKVLPLLESLECSKVSVERPVEVDSLATCLKNSVNLKRLALHDVDVIDGSWGCHEGPPQLINLSLRDCANLWLSNTPWLISTWAPGLTHLELKFDEPWNAHFRPLQEDLSEFEPRHHQFDLPSLTHLTIWRHSSCDYFHCFKDSKTIEVLKVYHLLPEDHITFIDFILGDPFPKLKLLSLLVPETRFPLDPESSERVLPLEAFCKSKGISFHLSSYTLSPQIEISLF
ncbi:uncharacterized protein MELLADRAFT_76514 [Melampsora larici-populina 98AG31]|uniref:F-box domain-containing protein n=1 Tax=Melampsora larici-populina (strain 98AG31 / pathotype 3-4-7) TaxID=747676 RepID=F4R543_MELLP|nr:uncharacterized protein MELLADRAFT_76514 [Melampsora larici-populina 98AG31]EGG12335.1 hypothetical protein MELLADRAFT_76514 [Melampsora larici-populina 98AG31]